MRFSRQNHPKKLCYHPFVVYFLNHAKWKVISWNDPRVSRPECSYAAQTRDGKIVFKKANFFLSLLKHESLSVIYS